VERQPKPEMGKGRDVSMDNDTTMIVLAALLAVSEALSLIPQVKANGVFQLVVNLIRKVLGK